MANELIAFGGFSNGISTANGVLKYDVDNIVWTQFLFFSNVSLSFQLLTVYLITRRAVASGLSTDPRCIATVLFFELIRIHPVESWTVQCTLYSALPAERCIRSIGRVR